MNFSGVLHFLNDFLDDDKVEFLLEDENEELLIAENNLGKITFFKNLHEEIELDLEKQSSKIKINYFELNSEIEKELLSSILKKASQMIEKLKKEKEEDLLESLMEFKNNFK